jgi:hypothetical protein
MKISLLALLAAHLFPPDSIRAASLEEAAKPEGEVVLYSSLNNEQIVILVAASKKSFRSSSHRSTAAPASGCCIGRDRRGLLIGSHTVNNAG